MTGSTGGGKRGGGKTAASKRDHGYRVEGDYLVTPSGVELPLF